MENGTRLISYPIDKVETTNAIPDDVISNEESTYWNNLLQLIRIPIPVEFIKKKVSFI